MQIDDLTIALKQEQSLNLNSQNILGNNEKLETDNMNRKEDVFVSETPKKNEQIELIEPLEVNDFHNIANQVHLILTDSGGVQEEAPSLNKPVLVLRENTERPEGVEAGTLKIVGTTFDSVFENTKKLIEDEEAYLKMCQARNPYGDGFALERIRDNILYYFDLIDEKPKPFK